MPHLDHSGPEGKGSKTGRKLGLCRKTEKDLNENFNLGKGLGKKRHSGEGNGQGKRIKYNQKD